MQVVTHLRAVAPSDSYQEDIIADDGREGKREEKLKAREKS